MIRRIKTLLPFAAVVFVAPVLAQPQQSQATSHKQLLEQVEQLRAAENAAFQTRKTEFESKGQAERDQLLRNAERRLRAMFRAFPEILLVYDRDGRILQANPAAAAALERGLSLIHI